MTKTELINQLTDAMADRNISKTVVNEICEQLFAMMTGRRDAAIAASARLEAIEIGCIVARQRGSWKWQDAYGVSYYSPRPSADGRWAWRFVRTGGGKFSRPQLLRRGDYCKLHEGPLHGTLV